MDATLNLLNLAGAIALLLWGVHMVQSGVQRAFGAELRRFLGYALGNRIKAAAAGLGVTAVLQSSTATGLMIASFAGARLRRPGSRAGGDAGRECRHDPDRAGAVVRRVESVAAAPACGRGDVSGRGRRARAISAASRSDWA